MPVPQFDEYDQAVLEVVHGEAGLRDLAVVTQMDFGHTDPLFVLPYGVLARVDPAGWASSARATAPSSLGRSVGILLLVVEACSGSKSMAATCSAAGVGPVSRTIETWVANRNRTDPPYYKAQQFSISSM
ncbi:MAG: hypothetical protein ACKVZ0_12450 [Gemmatimonadales bacterium]